MRAWISHLMTRFRRPATTVEPVAGRHSIPDTVAELLERAAAIDPDTTMTFDPNKRAAKAILTDVLACKRGTIDMPTVRQQAALQAVIERALRDHWAPWSLRTSLLRVWNTGQPGSAYDRVRHRLSVIAAKAGHTCPECFTTTHVHEQVARGHCPNAACRITQGATTR